MSDCGELGSGESGNSAARNDCKETESEKIEVCSNATESENMIERIINYVPLEKDVTLIMAQESFPYPELGKTARPAGQGCRTCVHKTYCEAFYWFVRRDVIFSDSHVGLACLSWSENPDDNVQFGNKYDINENTRRNIPSPTSPITEQADLGYKSSQFNDLGNGPSAP
jgi:hypothetical protein